MNNRIVLPALLALGSIAAAAPSLAQEHYTEGNVITCDQYRVKEGKADAYARYLRATVVPQTDAAKKAGLMVDRYYFLRDEGPASAWNYMSCVALKNFAAFDYNAAEEKKMDEIAAAQLKTADKTKQAEQTKARFEMRDYKGTTTLREIFLKPLP
jgi:hypothetical protein